MLKLRTFQAFLCTIFALVFVCSCTSTNINTGEIADALSNRLTDALNFKDGTVKNGEPPAGKSGDVAPQINEIEGTNLALGEPFAFNLKSDFPEESKVAKSFIRVKGASKYIEVSGHLDSGSFRLSGNIKNDPELNGKNFKIEFALQTIEGITGVYQTIELKVISDSDSDADGDTSYIDGDAINTEGEATPWETDQENEIVNNGPTPEPKIKAEIPEEKDNPEPLDIIHLDGRQSTSPFGEDRKPFTYYWQWEKKPQHASDTVLICSTCSPDNPKEITGQWTPDGYPKVYFPIAGEYVVSLKVKDSSGVESGPSEGCPNCPEKVYFSMNVRPSQRLHVELLWDRGDNVDLDLFLVRAREDGTFAVPSTFHDRVRPDPATMPSCDPEDTSACFDGAFTCDQTSRFCENKCPVTTDGSDGCKKTNPGWYCNTTKDQCEASLDGTIECEKDGDCPAGGFCNPANTKNSKTKIFCTKHDSLSVNDTCYFSNGTPRWGTIDAQNPMLSGHTKADVDCDKNEDCNVASSGTFDCSNKKCDFSCTSHAECLSFSDHFLCHPEGYCVENSTEDDPSLDIDDVNGWGPENISLKKPVTGKYRVIARLYADPSKVVGTSKEGPNKPVRAIVHIWLNGQTAFKGGLSHDFETTSTYWKVADINWNAEQGDYGEGTVTPICAGWTKTECDISNDQCPTLFGEGYKCETRQWGTYCSTCEISGSPEQCNPTISCFNKTDCTTEAVSKECTSIQGNYCRCASANEYGSFETDPYANPFTTLSPGYFDPNDYVQPRSIWCDATYDTYNSQGDTCEYLYSN